MCRESIWSRFFAPNLVRIGFDVVKCRDAESHSIRIGVFSVLAVLLAVNSAIAVNIRTGFEPEEGYSTGKLTPSQPSPIGDMGWGNNVWTDLGGNNADPQGVIVASADAPQGLQYYQRLGGGNNNLAIREFPVISVSDGDFSIRWQVRIDSDQTAPPYVANFATIEVDDTGPGGRIMTFRYDDSGDINLSSVQDGIAKWDGTGDPAHASALNQFVKGGLNVYWAAKEIEVFVEDTAGQLISIGTFSFRETNTNQVDRIFLGVGPGGTAQQGVSWDDITMSSVLLPEPVERPMTASNPSPADGALVEATWANLSWSPGAAAVSHDVYIGEDFDDVNNSTVGAPEFIGNQNDTMLVIGFPGFPFPDGLNPGTTYYWRIDEVNDANAASPWKGDIWSFAIPPKTAYNPNPADGAEFVNLDATLSWTPGYGAKLHTIYIGDDLDDVNNAAGGAAQGAAAFDPGTLEREKVLYWRVDEFDGSETYKGDIWAFTTPGAAGNSQPANGAVDVPLIMMLTWTPAETASSHDLYFGTDRQAVENATTASPEFKGNKAKGAESYDPGKLAWDSDYYWRVDAVYNTGTVKGLVWRFTTADFLLVDDFESYNDIDPPDPNSNRIFDVWIDGFAATDNGALVGNDLPPYAEQTVVHGGAQSMPYRYDNNLKTSEATLTLVSRRDWTAEGVTKLSLWFRGAAANAPERMFIALNGSAVVYQEDPTVTQTRQWTRWVVDLRGFADQGVNLTSVNTITIGFGTKDAPAAGGTGTMYLDDIRLYR